MTDIITLDTAAGPVRLRPEQASDQDFLFALFHSHMVHELALMPVDDATRALLVQMQFKAQTTSYRAQFATARFDIVEVDDKPVGRIVVHDDGEAGCIVDFALVPERRARGLGSAILAAVLDGFAATQRPMRCKVLSHNLASLRMCERVGFRQIGGEPPFLQMEWQPGAVGMGRATGQSGSE